MFHVEHKARLSLIQHTMKKTESTPSATKSGDLASQYPGMVAHVRKAQSVQVRTGKEVEDVAVVAELGGQIVQGLVDLSDKYFKLVSTIREKKISAECVRDGLEPLGFPASRISEINKVAYSPDDVWLEYKSRKLSFRNALNVTRGTMKLLLADSGEKTVPKWVDQIPEEGTDAKEENGGVQLNANTGKVEEPKPPMSSVDRAEILARKLAGVACEAKWRMKEWGLENGYIVRVSKGRQWGVKKEHKAQFPEGGAK